MTNTSIKKGHIKTCVSIIRIQSTKHKKEICLCTQYAPISSKDKCKFEFYGESPQLFENNCTGTGVIEMDHKNGGGYVCDGCFDIKKRIWPKYFAES